MQPLRKPFVISFLFTLFIAHSAVGQVDYTINGTVKDATTGEDLIGAVLQVLELPATGTSANIYGFYSLTVPSADYTLRYSYIGYEPVEKSISLITDMKIDIELAPNTKLLKEVVIRSEAENSNVTKNEMSVVKVSAKEIESIPVIFGEKDVLKVLQLSPGVQSAGEGSSGFYVRGGGADQNLIILDEAPVYNASHLLGFFSVFNSDIVKDVTLYKGGIPARYGGRGSSVLDIKMNEGNNKEMKVKGGIGLISSKLSIEAPIVKNKGSFNISARRTYADFFLKLLKDKDAKKNKLFFYDLTAKANYTLGRKDRLFLSGYFGRDKLGSGNRFSFDWGNKTATLRWNHIFGKKLFSNTSAIFSDYSYKIKITEDSKNLVLSSLIRDLNLKQAFTYYLSDKQTLEFGANAIYHRFLPGALDAGEASSIKLSNKNGLESGVYVSDKIEISKRAALTAGLRFSHFNYLGPGKKYEFDEEGRTTLDQTIAKGKSIQTYGGLEPRLNFKFELNDVSSLKASYNRNIQYMHLLSNTTSSQPTDIWVPSTNNVKPLKVDQVAMGYFRNLKDNMYALSVEGYYKDMKNQLDYKDGADLFLNEKVESQLLLGKGHAYGAELMVKKTGGKLTGWIGYTYSRSFKQIPGVNSGKAYPAKQDRKHDISIVAMYNISERVKLASNWVYYTGNAVTFPSGRYVVDGLVAPFYTERNGYRMPDYHRLDIGVTLESKKYKERQNFKSGEVERIPKRVESTWNFSIYNAYARNNAYTITFRQNENDPTKTEAVQTTLFSIVPSISYNFKF